jgi:recombinational DNA repair ATPase RecF
VRNNLFASVSFPSVSRPKYDGGTKGISIRRRWYFDMTHFTWSTIIFYLNNSINTIQNNRTSLLNTTQNNRTAPTENNSTMAIERHRLDGSREKSAKSMRPVLHDQRPFTKLWSQKLHKIFYSVIGYLYYKFVSLKYFRWTVTWCLSNKMYAH